MGKSKLNSFYFFMQEQRRLKPAWKNKSNIELMELCDSLWQKLNPEEKMRFEEMKKIHANNDPEAREKERKKGEVRISGGLDHLGRPLVEIERRDRERRMDIESKIEAVASMVESASLSGDLEVKKFYVIQTNVFVKTDEDPPNFVPAEVSIAKFSLQEGVMKVYQAFTVPGEIPIGHKRLCLESSKDGHKIPLEIDNIDIEQLNMKTEKFTEFKQRSDLQILQDIVEFLSGDEIVFCMPERTAQCEGVLRTISNRSKLILPKIKILSLPELLFRLSNSSKEGTVLPTSNMAEIELEKERFLYQAGLSCSWHETMTDTNTCTSATVWRWCFTVLDLCCQHYDIALLSGKHVPNSVDAQKVGQRWNTEEQGKSRWNIASRQVRNTVRQPGGFVSEDIRFKEEVVEKQSLDNIGQVTDGKKVNNVLEHIKEVQQRVSKDMLQQAGTISDYIGAMSDDMGNVTIGNCSSDSESEFVTMDSISQASSICQGATVQPAVVRKGLGRGTVLPGRRFSRMAATFPSSVGPPVQ